MQELDLGFRKLLEQEDILPNIPISFNILHKVAIETSLLYYFLKSMCDDLKD